MTREDRHEFIKVLEAHARTVELCEACAVTTRDLAAEVRRGGMPPAGDLERTVAAADGVLDDLAAVRREINRLRAALA